MKNKTKKKKRDEEEGRWRWSLVFNGDCCLVSAKPFDGGCRNFGEALRRIRKRAAMIRTKGEARMGNVAQAVMHVRSVMGAIRLLQNMDDDVFAFKKKVDAPYKLFMQTKQLGKLPVVQFAVGGIAIPMMMQLECDGVFVWLGIFKSGDPAKRAKAIVQAVTNYINAEVSCGLGEAMVCHNLNDKVVTMVTLKNDGFPFL